MSHSIEDLVKRMQDEHYDALCQAVLGESPFRFCGDVYFDHCGPWASALYEQTRKMEFSIPTIGPKGTPLGAPAVMREYNRASDCAPLYLTDMACSACSEASRAGHCNAAFKVCGRRLLAHFVWLELRRAED